MLINQSAVLDYGHLITTQPHSIRRVFISDLHLSTDEPALVQAFLALLNDLAALPNLQELYILGDWFDAWIGDDAYLSLSHTQKEHHWITPFLEKLITLSNNTCQIFVMHGNRDFVLGQKFCDIFKGKLIAEPYNIQVGQRTFRLEHGDALCTDDKAYQRFRKIIRNPFIQWFLLRKSLHNRQKIAENIRQHSAKGKSKKAEYIMDVNELAVAKALQNVDALLHGHTHRPNMHELSVNNKLKQRYVLGDWRVIKSGSSYEKVEAIIGVTIQPESSEAQTAEKIVKNRIQVDNPIINAESFNLINFQH